MQGSKKQARYRVLDRHLNRLIKQQRKLAEIERRFFWIRLVVLFIITSGIVLIFIRDLSTLGMVVLILSISSFIVVVILHQRVDLNLARFKAASQDVRAQLARMDLNWSEIPVSLDLTDDIGLTPKQVLEHPFVKDIEIIGNGSLMHLVDVAVTMGGSRRLLCWFLNQNPDVTQIRSRQQSIREMISLYGFRSRLRLHSELIAEGEKHKRWDVDRIVNWLDDAVKDNSLLAYVVVLFALALINGALLILNVSGILPPFWILTLAVYGIIYNLKYKQSESLFGDAYQIGSMMGNLKSLFLYLERYPYPRQGSLVDLCAPFSSTKAVPSKYIRRISRIISAASLQNNQLLWLIINAAVPWGLFFAYQLDKYRGELKSRLPEWLNIWYELEAINSLANFSFINPDYVNPILRSKNAANQSPVFEARDLGHPLILDHLRVCNDFAFDTLGEIALVSGSNMSGKSTFLRTIGINLTLTYAGGVVNASELITIPFRLFTAINVLDSLSDGISYFYAEVERLKALLDQYNLDSDLPLFFLIDEIFRGTNNREREIGSRSYVKSLVGGRGVGLISTHDLALVDLGDMLSSVSNFHFRELVIENRMVFDYRLHPGPCPTTNALMIMELEGLPVETSSPPEI